MHYSSLLYAQFVVLIVLAVFHLLALEYYLYWHFVWIDTVSHALGGLWAGLCGLWIRSLFGHKLGIAWGILGALILGVIWEVFEIMAGIPREANFVLDTSIDLFMDALGGVVAGFAARALVKAP